MNCNYLTMGLPLLAGMLSGISRSDFVSACACLGGIEGAWRVATPGHQTPASFKARSPEPHDSAMSTVSPPPDLERFATEPGAADRYRTVSEVVAAAGVLRPRHAQAMPSFWHPFRQPNR